MDTHKVREAQEAIRILYGIDASRHEKETARKLHIRRIYDMIPSQMGNRKKQIEAKDIRNRKWNRFCNYLEESE